jgi:hypothetical protein
MTMDQRVFEELTKHIAAAPTRRAMLRTLSGGMAAALIATLHREAVAAAEEAGGEGFCRPRKFPCNKKQQCCARKCKAGRCGCWKKGHDCISGLGATCCSGTCDNRGKCK